MKFFTRAIEKRLGTAENGNKHSRRSDSTTAESPVLNLRSNIRLASRDKPTAEKSPTDRRFTRRTCKNAKKVLSPPRATRGSALRFMSV
jgi:hypothetical protein